MRLRPGPGVAPQGSAAAQSVHQPGGEPLPRHARALRAAPLIVALEADGPLPARADVHSSSQLQAEPVVVLGNGDVEDLDIDALAVEAGQGMEDNDDRAAAQEGEAGPGHEVELAVACTPVVAARIRHPGPGPR